MRFWKKKEEAPEPTPALKVTFRYMTGSVGGFVTLNYENRTVTDLYKGIENDRRNDLLIALGQADRAGSEIRCFPARSIVDVTIVLAEEGE